MDRKTCFIVGAGSFSGMNFSPASGDLVIAADGGYTYLEQLGIRPDVLMGDFDSLKRVPEHEHLIRHSPIKDDTDMALAAAYGAEKGFTRFFLYGGLGGRLDHTIANLQLLTGMSANGLEAYLIGSDCIITSITSERVSFGSDARGMISVFCMGPPAEGVYERGLKYGLENAVMTCDRTLGVSNEFTGTDSSIEVHRGSLLIMWEDCGLLPADRAAAGSRMNHACAGGGTDLRREEVVQDKARSLLSPRGWHDMHRENDTQ